MNRENFDKVTEALERCAAAAGLRLTAIPEYSGEHELTAFFMDTERGTYMQAAGDGAAVSFSMPASDFDDAEGAVAKARRHWDESIKKLWTLLGENRKEHLELRAAAGLQNPSWFGVQNKLGSAEVAETAR